MSDSATASSRATENATVRQLVETGLSPRAAEAVQAIDTTMTDFRRSMARRELGRMAVRELGLDIDASDLELMSVLAPGGSHGTEEEITIGLVAAKLGIDPSRASRIVAEAVEKGIVTRVASQSDARKICLELTDKGREYSRAVARYKFQVFADASKEWPEDELVEFARLFNRFCRWVDQIKTRAGA